MESNGRYSTKKACRDQLVTLGDLQEFKDEVLNSIKLLVIRGHSPSGNKQWLKSYEVRKMLGISPGTLQTLRNNRTMPFTRIGGIMYYNLNDVNQMLIDRKSPSKKESKGN